MSTVSIKAESGSHSAVEFNHCPTWLLRGFEAVSCSKDKEAGKCTRLETCLRCVHRAGKEGVESGEKGDERPAAAVGRAQGR